MEKDRLTVEASMGAGETLLVAVVPVYVESADAVHALKFLEAVERHFGSSCHELEELRPLFLVEGTDCSPEPLDLLRGGRVVVILGIALPVINIDVGETRDQKLKLLFVEDCNELLRNYVMEA